MTASLAERSVASVGVQALSCDAALAALLEPCETMSEMHVDSQQATMRARHVLSSLRDCDDKIVHRGNGIR